MPEGTATIRFIDQPIPPNNPEGLSPRKSWKVTTDGANDTPVALYDYQGRVAPQLHQGGTYTFEYSPSSSGTSMFLDKATQVGVIQEGEHSSGASQPQVRSQRDGVQERIMWSWAMNAASTQMGEGAEVSDYNNRAELLVEWLKKKTSEPAKGTDEDIPF